MPLKSKNKQLFTLGKTKELLIYFLIDFGIIPGNLEQIIKKEGTNQSKPRYTQLSRASLSLQTYV